MRMRRSLALIALALPVAAGCSAPYADMLDYSPGVLVADTGDPTGAKRMQRLAEVTHATAPADGTLTLQQCIAAALSGNRQIRIADRKVESSHAVEKSIESGYFPKLYADGNFQLFAADVANSPLAFVEGNVTLEVPIFTFGKLEYAMDAARHGTRANEFAAQRTRQLLALAVSLAYVDVLEAWQFKRVTEASIDSITQQLSLAKSREEAGVGRKADVLSAQVQLADRATNLEIARSNVVIALANLNRLMGVNVLEPTQLVDVADIDTDASGETFPASDVEFIALLQQAMQNRPDLRALAAKIDATRSGFLVSKSALFPTLGAVGRFTANTEPVSATNPAQQGGFVGVQLDLPLFNQATYADLGGKRLDILAAIDDRAEAVDDLALELTDALARLRGAESRIPVTRAAIQAGEENLRLVREEFQAGTRTSADVLIEEDRLNQSRLNYYRAVYDHQRAHAQLRSVIAEDPLKPATN
ncbi:MAG: TolC family protein [Planctomycetota bacterium]